MMFRISSVAALAMAAGLSLTPVSLAQQSRDEDGYYQQQRQRQEQQRAQPNRTQQDTWPGRQDQFPGRGNAYGARDRFEEEYGRYSGDARDLQDQNWRMEQRQHDRDPAHMRTSTSGGWNDEDRWRDTRSQNQFWSQDDQRMRSQQRPESSQSMQQTSRSGMQPGMLDGRIQQVAFRNLQGSEHLTVLLDSDRGPNWVDLGPVASQQQLLSALLRGDNLQIDATPAQAGQYFVARTINVEGRTIPVPSTTSMYQSTTTAQNYGTSEPTYSSSTTQVQGNTLNGTVRTVEVRNLDGDEHVVVLLNSDRGPNWVDLGPVSVMREHRNLIREGETITVSAAPAPGGEQYFVARNLTVRGREIPIQTTSTFESRTIESASSFDHQAQMRSSSSLSGSVQDVQVRTIDGERHIVALVNTDRGANWIDLGSEESAQQFRNQIREGTTITVQASPASGGEYFVASNLNLSGRSFPIQTSSTTMRSSQQTFGTTDQAFDSQQRQQDWRTQQGQNQQQDWRQQQNQNWQQQNWYQNQSGQSGQQSPSSGSQTRNYYQNQNDQYQRDQQWRQNDYYNQQRSQPQQNRDFYQNQNDQYQRDQQFRQNDPYYQQQQQPPYGRAQGYRENRGMDPLYGEPGRRTGQQTGASDTTRRDQQQRMEEQRRLEEQRRREDERRRERDSDER